MVVAISHISNVQLLLAHLKLAKYVARTAYLSPGMQTPRLRAIATRCRKSWVRSWPRHDRWATVRPATGASRKVDVPAGWRAAVAVAAAWRRSARVRGGLAPAGTWLDPAQQPHPPESP